MEKKISKWNCCKRQRKIFLNVTERFYISFYNSTDKRYGYNITEGGSSAGSRKKVLSEKEELRVIALKEGGWSSVKIAEEFGIDKGTVKNIFVRHNKEMPNKRNLEDRINLTEFESYILHNQPTYKELEERFGICKGSIYNLLREINNPLLQITPVKRVSNAVTYEKEIIRKYQKGYNIQDLVKMFHSPKRYISKILHNAGVTIQRGRKSIEYNISKSVPTLTGEAEG